MKLKPCKCGSTDIKLRLAMHQISVLAVARRWMVMINELVGIENSNKIPTRF